MKKMTKLFATLVALVSCYTLAVAQNFEGKLTMKIEALELPAEYQPMKSMFESTITIYSKGSKSRVETANAMTGSTIVFTDTVKKESVACMDMMGQKFSVITNYGEVEKENPAIKGKFKKLNDTKTIAGYKCKKGIYTTEQNGKKQEIEIWYTEEIPNTKSDMREIPGMPMEFNMKVENITLRNHITEVSKEKVSDDKLNVPDGYPVKTQEEVSKIFGGMMGK